MAGMKSEAVRISIRLTVYLGLHMLIAHCQHIESYQGDLQPGWCPQGGPLPRYGWCRPLPGHLHADCLPLLRDQPRRCSW